MCICTQKNYKNGDKSSLMLSEKKMYEISEYFIIGVYK
jgi:hypothetical protein